MDQNQNPQSIIWKAMDCGFGCSFVWLFCNLMNGKVVGTPIFIDKNFLELKILLESAFLEGARIQIHPKIWRIAIPSKILQIGVI